MMLGKVKWSRWNFKVVFVNLSKGEEDLALHVLKQQEYKLLF
jgi:hypothetical protein